MHFVGKPLKLEVDERRRIADEVAEVNGLITNEEGLRRSEFPFPVATSKPIEGLAAPKRGMFMPTIISIIREGEDEMGASIINEMKGHGINERDEMQVYKWFGQKGGMEVSRLVQVYHRIVKGI